MAVIIHNSFLSEGEIIKADKYCNVIEEMHRKLSNKQPALINRIGSILLHDNAMPIYCKEDTTKIEKLVL